MAWKKDGIKQCGFQFNTIIEHIFYLLITARSMQLVRWNDDGFACATCINLVTILFFDTRYLHAASVCEYFRFHTTSSVTKRGRKIKEGGNKYEKEGRKYNYYLTKIAYTHILMHYIGKICFVLFEKSIHCSIDEL